MTLTQLRYLCEIVRHDLHLSRASEALHTSQPGVSKQIQLLEQELGCLIFKRKRNRLLGLTPTGEEVYRYARQALLETENIRSIGHDSDAEISGTIVLASTRTQARYVLPTIVERFLKRFPKVHFEFWQGHRYDVFSKVDIGDADIGIGTDRGVSFGNVSMLRYGTLHHSLVMKAGHPLLQFKKPPLREVAKYPIITHYSEPDGQWKLTEVFEKKGLRPNIIFRAIDADVSKAYVELGIGIAVLANSAYDKDKDRHLRAVSADYLFDPEPLFIGLNRKRYVSRALFELIRMIAPNLHRAEIERALDH